MAFHVAFSFLQRWDHVDVFVQPGLIIHSGSEVGNRTGCLQWLALRLASPSLGQGEAGLSLLKASLEQVSKWVYYIEIYQVFQSTS